MKQKKQKFNRCRKHGIIYDLPCHRCVREKERTENGECNAILRHGPGHQSTTYCQVKGEHKIHKAIYGCYDETATWIGRKPKFTGYFDEAPDYEDDRILRMEWGLRRV